MMMKIGIGALIVVLLYVIICYNGFIHLRNKCEEADAGIDVALAKRYTLLQNMVEVCKGYMTHEKETLMSIIELRKKMPMQEKILANQKMNQMHADIQILAEQYPQLKAEPLFSNLQHTLVDVEEHLQASRRAYNANVSLLNQKAEMFPSNLIAFFFRVKKRSFFEANETEKVNPNIKFS